MDPLTGGEGHHHNIINKRPYHVPFHSGKNFVGQVKSDHQVVQITSNQHHIGSFYRHLRASTLFRYIHTYIHTYKHIIYTHKQMMIVLSKEK